MMNNHDRPCQTISWGYGIDVRLCLGLLVCDPSMSTLIDSWGGCDLRFIMLDMYADHRTLRICLTYPPLC